MLFTAGITIKAEAINRSYSISYYSWAYVDTSTSVKTTMNVYPGTSVSRSCVGPENSEFTCSVNGRTTSSTITLSYSGKHVHAFRTNNNSGAKFYDPFGSYTHFPTTP